MCGSGSRSPQEQIPVRAPAVILAPSHLAGVGHEVAARDVMVRANLRPAQAGQVTLGLVRANPIVEEGDGVVDPVHVIAGVTLIA